MNIRSAEHYLRRNSANLDRYFQGLLSVLTALGSHVENKDIAHLIDKKLQVGIPSFDEDQYIQAASELTVMSHFLQCDDVEFIYENKISPPKDVDFTIKKII